MRWPLGKYRVFDRLLPLIICSIPLAGNSEVDPDRLWVPTKYQTRFIDLIKAANTAESIDRCVTVLLGTIDLDRSASGDPVYRILCRQENGQSYNEMVDGITFETLTTPKIVIVPLTPEELEEQKREEERKKVEALERRKVAGWTLCLEHFDLKTQYMIELQRITQDRPEPTLINNQQMDFSIDFNAENTEGTPLKYSAYCRIEDAAVGKFSIKGRKK